MPSSGRLGGTKPLHAPIRAKEWDLDSGPFLQTFATTGFSYLVSLLALLGALQAAYFVVSGGLKGTSFYYRVRIRDADPAVRASTIRTLAVQGDAKAMHFLMQALGDPEASLRLIAVEGLRRHTDSEVHDALLQLVDDPDVGVRKAVISALGRYHTPQAVQALVKALSDPHAPVQIAAIQGLKVAQDPTTIEAIAATLSSKDKEVVRNAQEALIPFGISVIDRLAPMLPEVSGSAAAFTRVMTHLDRDLAYQAIGKVLPSMRHVQPIGEAITMLVRSQVPGLAGLLSDLLMQPDYPAYDIVVNGMVRLQDPETVEPLCRQLRNPRLRRKVVSALEMLAPAFGREMLAPLGSVIQDQDLAVRKAAAYLLGKVGGTMMIDTGLLLLWGEGAPEHRAYLEEQLGAPLGRIITYPEAALALDKLMTNVSGEDGQRAIGELESLVILLFGEYLRGVRVHDNTVLLLKDRRTLYPLRPEHLHPLAVDLLEYAANMAEGDRFRLTAN